MDNQKIYDKIEKIYNSDKGKNFIIHLLRSFFPVGKSDYLWDTPKDKSKLVCCITGIKLSSKEDLFKLSQTQEFKDAFFDNVRKVASGEASNLPNSFESLRKKANPLAISSENSDKYLSQEAYEQLLNFYQTRLLLGDKKLNWTVRNEQANELIKQGREEGYIETKQEEKAVRRVVEHTKSTLGDLKALQDLKKKFDNK